MHFFCLKIDYLVIASYICCMHSNTPNWKDIAQLTFEEQILNLQENLLMFALKLTGNRENANDLLQETILKAMKNKDKYTENTNLKGWMFTIMRNIFINEYRRAAVRKTTVDNTEDSYFLNLPQDSGFSTPEGSYTLTEIEKAIASFKDEYRVPFTMHVVGFKYKEIAEKMDLPIGTVKSRIFFARKQLAEMLKDFRYDR